MRAYLPFVIVGLSTGSVYGIAAMGLVLTYKTSGVFNFAHGAVGAIGAYGFYELHQQHHVPWPVAAAVSITVVGASTVRKLRQAAKDTVTVNYIGVACSTGKIFDSSWLRGQTASFGLNQVITFLVALGAGVGLTAFFRYTRMGVAMRGVVDDPSLLALSATSPVRVRTRSWVIGSAFAAASGVLLVPTIGLDAGLLTLLVVQAFGAAAIGAFSSLPLTYVGGLAVGIGAELSKKIVISRAESRTASPRCSRELR